ncbi:hypothetical protein J3E64_000047 [Sphingobium sp. OAS761]|uniref:hypothetical protein n=1 Tax=Sphingobium sp. OAS761 TaxID=2817901 RepID=UPI00209D9CB4|nr:hypothetical protein [Sphingobium sp. OAS761]MCP1468380.1 hypothetical protein [Sphingobium sp. OAS761]
MLITSWIMVVGAIVVAAITLSPRLLRNRSWRATVTPLASIIGSGFLVAAPVLGQSAGRFALFAMLGLCAIAWLFGSAIRHNIRVAEPLIEPDGSPLWLERIDKASDLSLAVAYFISVAYYLNLFAAFALRNFGITDLASVQWLSVSVIALIGLIGTLRGLRWLENIELPAVGLKLALIAGLILALGWAVGDMTLGGDLALPVIDHPAGMRELGILLGLVIMVQGFETSRYLGHAYDAALRIRTMRRAQIIATIIYGAFIALMTPFFGAGVGDGPIEETAIIDMLRPLGWAVVPLVTITALASQLSAAVADMNGAGGLVRSASSNRVSVKWGYAATAGVAIAITLAADLFQIIVYASKAFVLYYGLQSATAAILCFTQDRRQPVRGLVYGVGVAIALAVMLLGIPAEGAG